MDRHSPGPLDALWPAVAAGAGAAALNTSIDTGARCSPQITPNPPPPGRHAAFCMRYANAFTAQLFIWVC